MENEKLSIGKHIAELRKQKGITQETLAEVVGVSGQAVSKWESGGSPDIELLQPIADYFGVSIDRLFGRTAYDFANVEASVVGYIGQTRDMKERLRKVFKLCWTMEFATFNSSFGDANIPDISVSSKQHSQILQDSCITSLNMREELRYFLIMPQPEAGWGKVLHYKDVYKDMLTALADEETLKTLFFLYARDAEKAFTPVLLEKHLGIEPEKAKAILEWLKNYNFVYTTEIELDDEMKIVYNFDANPAFVPFLTFLEELIHKPNSFCCYQGGRKKPYL